MNLLESITLRDFSTHKCNIIDNKIIVISDNNEAKIFVSKLQSVDGLYKVTINIEADNTRWYGTYSGNKDISLLYGENIFNIEIDDQKESFDIGILFPKLDSKQEISMEIKITNISNSVSIFTPIVTCILVAKDNFANFIRVVSNFTKQRFKNFELLIIDNTCDKPMFTKKKEHIRNLDDPRFKIFYNENKMNISEILNKGISNAKGEYITWAADCNEYYPNYLEALYDTNYDFIYTCWDSYNEMTKITKKIKKSYSSLKNLMECFCGLAAFMWKKNLIDQIGNYDELIDSYENFDYLIRTYMNTNKILFKKVYTMKYHHIQDLDTTNSSVNLRNEIKSIYNFIVNSKEKDICIYKSKMIYTEQTYMNLPDFHKFRESMKPTNLNVLIISNYYMSYNTKYKFLVIPEKLKNVVINAAKGKNIIPLCEAVNETNMSTHDIKCVINEPQAVITEPKISVVIGYNNNEDHLQHCLQTIYASEYKNIEIIVVSSAVSKLTDLPSNIKLIHNFNQAFMQATGKIIMLQSSEIYHIDDVLSYTKDNLRQNDYFSFSCYSLSSDDKEKPFTNNNNWLNHIEYFPSAYYYLCALYRNSLLEMGGVDEDYQAGIYHENDDFIRRLVKHKMNIQIIPKNCVKQWTPPESKSVNYVELWKKNLFIFWDKSTSYNLDEVFYCNFSHNNKSCTRGFNTRNYLYKNEGIIPKKLHTYVPQDLPRQGLSPASGCLPEQGLPRQGFPNNISIETFLFYNNDWEVFIYTPTSYESRKNNIHHVVVDNKPNQWEILYNQGGVWCEPDIFFTNNIPKINSITITKDMKFIAVLPGNELINLCQTGNPETILKSPDVNIVLDTFYTLNPDALVYKKMEIAKFKKNFVHFRDYSFIPFYHIKANSFTVNCENNYRLIKTICDNQNGIGFNTDGEICLSDAELVPKIDYSRSLNGCYIRNDVYPKISIVCTYYNRKQQMITTLNSIEKSHYKNIEVIIVDDNSIEAERLEDIVNDYPFIIKLKRLEEHDKTYSNPCIPYNKGFELVAGEITIIQNSEVCHINDIIQYVSGHITENDYISFPCYTSPSFDKNLVLAQIIKDDIKMDNEELMKQIGGPDYNKLSNWYNHKDLKPKYFHFCAALFTKNLRSIRGFSTKYKNGCCFDDNDLVLRIRYDLKLNLTIPSTDYLVVHQYHKPNIATNCNKNSITDPTRIKFNKNNDLYDRECDYRYRLTKSKASEIPFIFNCYWDLSALSYLAYLTILSFLYYNPHWKIHIYVPTNRCYKITWTSTEQKDNYTGKDYWDDLIKLPNTSIIEVDFEDIGFHNNISEVIKSDYVRWHILSTTGGIWSDFDILYINSIQDTILANNMNFDTLIFDILHMQKNYYPIGFFMSRPNNEFFAKLKELSKTYYDPKLYQCIGADMIKQVWPQSQNIVNEFKQVSFLIEDKFVYLPFLHKELDKLFHIKSLKSLHSKTVGIHWFNGTSDAKDFQNNIELKLRENNSTLAFLVNKFLDVIDKDFLDKDVVPLK